MESRAINDLSNKWIEENINAAYFKEIKDYLKNGGDVKIASDKVGAFLQYGCDLSDEDRKDLSKYYTMNKEEEKTALIARLKKEIRDAKQAVKETDSSVLKKLVSYVDDEYSVEVSIEKPGLDAMSCEYLIAKIRYALDNIDRIDSEKLAVELFEDNE